MPAVAAAAAAVGDGPGTTGATLHARAAAAKPSTQSKGQFGASAAGMSRLARPNSGSAKAASSKESSNDDSTSQGRASEPRPSDVPPIDFGLAFALAPVGLIVSRQRIMVDCNEVACEIFGFSRELMIGQSFQLIYPSMDEYLRQGERMLPALGTRGRWSDQRVMRRASGESFWCRVSGRALDRSDPHASGIWCFEDLGSRQPVKAELTSREREVAARLLDGLTSKEIGRALGISHRTVEIHRARLMRKYSAATSAELVQKLLLGLS